MRCPVLSLPELPLNITVIYSKVVLNNPTNQDVYIFHEQKGSTAEEKPLILNSNSMNFKLF